MTAEETRHYREYKHLSLLLVHISDKDHGEGEKEDSSTAPSFSLPHAPLFLINIVHVVRLCLIMHDCYQQQNPLNEAPLNGNTIIPPGAQEERQDCFFFPL